MSKWMRLVWFFWCSGFFAYDAAQYSYHHHVGDLVFACLMLCFVIFWAGSLTKEG